MGGVVGFGKAGDLGPTVGKVGGKGRGNGDRPQRGCRMVAVRGSGKGKAFGRVFSRKQKLRHQIARQKWCVDRAGHQMRRPKAFGMDQRRMDARKRTLWQGVGHNVTAETGKARRVTVGRDQQPLYLRLKPVDDVGNKRPTGQRDKSLVRPAHPPGLTARKDDPEDAQLSCLSQWWTGWQTLAHDAQGTSGAG